VRRSREHFLKGGVGPRALRYVDPALTHLEKSYLSDAASRLAGRALDAPGLFVGAARVQVARAQGGAAGDARDIVGERALLTRRAAWRTSRGIPRCSFA